MTCYIIIIESNQDDVQLCACLLSMRVIMGGLETSTIQARILISNKNNPHFPAGEIENTKWHSNIESHILQ